MDSKQIRAARAAFHRLKKEQENKPEAGTHRVPLTHVAALTALGFHLSKGGRIENWPSKPLWPEGIY